MAVWSLLHMKSPKNTVSGTGLVRELTHASSRSMRFSLDQPDTLDFTLPGRSIQTAQINVLSDDVLVFRDDEVVQRFRIVSRSIGRSGGELNASYSCVAYKALADAWIFHEADKRSWAESESAASREQTLIAWSIFQQGQSRSIHHNLGVSRGPLPVSTVSRVLEIPANYGGPSPEDYFQVGQQRRPAIDDLAAMDDGFDWDIIPDPNDPMMKLLFCCWTQGDGGRGGDSTFILDDGGNVASWDINLAPSEYANVIRATGSQLTDENFPVDGQPGTAFWWNGSASSENPAGAPLEGAWERDVNDDWKDLATITSGSKEEYTKLHDKVEEITVTLARGRWPGLSTLWLGDSTRFLVTVPVNDQPGTYVINRDQTVRIMEVNVTVDDLGAEDVVFNLERPAFDHRRDVHTQEQRLRRLEIR